MLGRSWDVPVGLLINFYLTAFVAFVSTECAAQFDPISLDVIYHSQTSMENEFSKLCHSIGKDGFDSSQSKLRVMRLSDLYGDSSLKG